MRPSCTTLRRINTNTNTNTKYTCDTGQTRNKLLALATVASLASPLAAERKAGAAALRAIAKKANDTRAEHELHAGVVAAGGIEALWRVLGAPQSNDVRVLIDAACAMEAFARVVREDCRAVSAAPAGVPVLVSLLRSSEHQLQASAVEILFRSSLNAAFATSVVAAGAVPPIVAMLDGVGASPAAAAATHALANLIGFGRGGNAVVAAGGIPRIVALLSARAEPVRASAAGALNNLTVMNDRELYATKIVEAGGVAPLLALLRPAFAETQEKAARTLVSVSRLLHYGLAHRVSSYAAERDQLAASIPAIVSLLSVPSNSDVCHTAMSLLRDIIASVKAADKAVKITEAGAVPLLAVLLQPHMACDLQADAAFMLRRLIGRNPDTNAAIAAGGAIPPLVALLASRSADVQARAVDALRYVSGDDANAVAVAAAGATPFLIALLQSPRSMCRRVRLPHCATWVRMVASPLLLRRRTARSRKS
jgi:hypothetical protein